MTRYVWRRLRHVFIYKILHADDTPHRIALGVAVGLLTAFSPLLGLHMLLALLISTIMRANRAVSVVVVWISNPATFLPILSFNWMVGHAVLPGSGLQGQAEVRALLVQLLRPAEGTASFLGHLFTVQFWDAVLQLFLQLGAELWIGSLLVGVVLGGLGYFVTRRAVDWRRRFRQLRRQRLALRALARTSPATAGRVAPEGHAPTGEQGSPPPPGKKAEIAAPP